MTDAIAPDRSAAVGAVTMARYLATNDPRFLAFLQASLVSASAAGIAAAELTMLQTVTGSIGG